MDMDRQISAHYGREGLEGEILKALRAAGKDVDRLAASDISAVDEFHLGWSAATDELIRLLAFRADSRVLDIGAGIGGPARRVAAACGCRVTGVDLTAEYVAVANALTRRCGLAERVRFEHASALSLPFRDTAFDGAMLIHVGMNIADKKRLFGEARRVLKHGAAFAVFEVMRTREGALTYPTPWAASEATSFLASPETYRELMQAASFVVEQERDYRDFVLRLFAQMREQAAKAKSPPLGLQVLIGPGAAERLGNVVRALEAGVVSPIAIVARAA